MTTLKQFLIENPSATATQAAVGSGWYARLPLIDDVLDSPSANETITAIVTAAQTSPKLAVMLARWQSGGQPPIDSDTATALLTIAGGLSDAAAGSLVGHVRFEPVPTDALIAAAHVSNAKDAALLAQRTQAEATYQTAVETAQAARDASIAAYEAEVADWDGEGEAP